MKPLRLTLGQLVMSTGQGAFAKRLRSVQLPRHTIGIGATRSGLNQSLFFVVLKSAFEMACDIEWRECCDISPS